MSPLTSKGTVTRAADGPPLTMIEARKRYFERSGLAPDGGYHDRLVKLRVLGLPIAFPNSPGRVRAVRYHDYHHVLTGYATDWRGEAEIGAWEVASGCRGFVAAWILNLSAFAIGLFIAPKRTLAAFLRGRRCDNLYELEDAELVATKQVSRLRAERGLERPRSPLAVRDLLAFALWSSAALGLVVIPPAMILIGALWIASARLGL